MSPRSASTSTRSRSFGTHVALLRGVNVGGKNKLPMKELVALVEALGGSEVRTYIQSGNVVFGATATSARSFAAELEDAIEGRFGFRAPVVLRSEGELRSALADRPFADSDPDTLHVGFLAGLPDPARVAALDPDRSPGDAFVVRGREIFLELPNGVARTKLTNAYFDSKLGTTSTFRNLRTVSALLELAQSR